MDPLLDDLRKTSSPKDLLFWQSKRAPPQGKVGPVVTRRENAQGLSHRPGFYQLT